MSTPSGATNHLVITAIGNDRPGIVREMTKTIADHNCSIIDSRMMVLGGEFALIMMVNGSWDAIAKVESAIRSCAQRLELEILVKQTETRQPQQKVMMYSVNVVALDEPGIVHEITGYFAKMNINISDLNTGTYSAPFSGAPMFSLTMTISIPAETHIAALREEFMLFCDERNLDAVIEPYRS